jgi:hypothetical protein
MSFNHPNTLSKPTKPCYRSITLGTGPKAVTVTVRDAPPLNARSEDKGVALTFLFNTLDPYSATIAFSEMAGCMRNLLPTTTHTAELEADSLGSTLRYALLNPDVATMVGVEFYNNLGFPVTALLDPQDRKGGKKSLNFVKVTSTVTPHDFDHRFNNDLRATATFYLALPQHQIEPDIARDLEVAFEATNPGTNQEPPNTPPTNPTRSVPATMKSIVSATSPNGSDLTFTFTGGLDFLESQAKFTATFSPHPVVYERDSNNKTFSITQPFYRFLAEVQVAVWTLYKELVWNDYVGTNLSDGVSAAAIFNTLHSIQSSTWNNNIKKMTYLTPEEIYTAYLEFIPMLPPDKTDDWGFHLHLTYMQSLTSDIQDMLADPHGPFHYKFPPLKSLHNKSTQMNALRDVRQLAMSAHNENNRIDARLRRIKHQNSPAQQHAYTATGSHQAPATAVQGSHQAPATMANAAGPSTDIVAYLSPAETTMTRYAPTGDNPVDPVTGFKSRFAKGFQGCFYCCSENHRYTQCPKRSDPDSSKTFHQDFHAHFPHLRKRPAETTEPTTKVARLLVTTGVAFLTAGSPTRAMPIAMDNRLPTAFFALTGGSVELGCLIDSCAGLSSGNRAFHDHVRASYPQCVTSFEEFNDANPFLPIKLGGAITNPEQYDPNSHHGLLTAVITYRAKSTDPATSTGFLLSFALGPDVSVNSLLGLPTLKSLRACIDIGANTLVCRHINETLPLLYLAPRCGAPIATSDRNHIQQAANAENRRVRFQNDTERTDPESNPNATVATALSLPPIVTGVVCPPARSRSIDNNPAWMKLPAPIIEEVYTTAYQPATTPNPSSSSALCALSALVDPTSVQPDFHHGHLSRVPR